MDRSQVSHFTVVTDAGEKRGREVALRLEQMRQVFGTLVLHREVRTSRPLQILAFKNSKGIRQMAPPFKGKPTELSGLYQKGQSKDYIALDLSTEGDYRWHTVFHDQQSYNKQAESTSDDAEDNRTESASASRLMPHRSDDSNRSSGDSSQGAPRRLTGMLIQVDCKLDGSGSLYMKDGDHLVLLRFRSFSETADSEAGELSCSTKQRRATVEYRVDGEIDSLSLVK